MDLTLTPGDTAFSYFRDMSIISHTPKTDPLLFSFVPLCDSTFELAAVSETGN